MIIYTQALKHNEIRVSNSKSAYYKEITQGKPGVHFPIPGIPAIHCFVSELSVRPISLLTLSERNNGTQNA